jgi:molecular chaperone HscB
MSDSTHRGVCRYCGAPAESNGLCGRCRAGERSDFFSVMGLPRRLDIDLQALESIYHRLSRDVHPDFHYHKPADEREEWLKRSASVNQAYRTLRDFHARVAYLVELEGGGAVKPQAPPELLEDVIEVQDLLEESRRGGAEGRALADRLQAERERLLDQLARLESDLKRRAQEWDGLLGAETERSPSQRQILRALQDLLSQRVYLLNLIRDLEAVPSSVA